MQESVIIGGTGLPPTVGAAAPWPTEAQVQQGASANEHRPDHVPAGHQKQSRDDDQCDHCEPLDPAAARKQPYGGGGTEDVHGGKRSRDKQYKRLPVEAGDGCHGQGQSGQTRDEHEASAGYGADHIAAGQPRGQGAVPAERRAELAVPAKYAFIVPSVNSTAARAAMIRTRPPRPRASSSASGA
jgi:hypothetical protein